MIGERPPAHWPPTLIKFIDQCIGLTRELIVTGSIDPSCFNTTMRNSPPPAAPHGRLRWNASSGYLYYDYSDIATNLPSDDQRKVKLKKRHETDIMATFLCDLLEGSLCSDSKQITHVEEFLGRRNFQTSEFEGWFLLF